MLAPFTPILEARSDAGALRHRSWVIPALAVAILTVLAGAPRYAVSAEIDEGGTDAGDLPETALFSDGMPFGEPLDAITGTIADEFDQDMFEIFIDDPSAFSASTDNAETDLDTQLFLFESEGFGVLANDDIDTQAPNRRSKLPVGSFTGETGRYFLAISIFDNDPKDVDQIEIFQDQSDDRLGRNLLQPIDGAGAVDGWTTEPELVPRIGPYRIELTGTTFVPEPSKALLATVALAVPAVLKALRPRRRTSRPSHPRAAA